MDGGAGVLGRYVIRMYARIIQHQIRVHMFERNRKHRVRDGYVVKCHLCAVGERAIGTFRIGGQEHIGCDRSVHAPSREGLAQS